MSGLGTFTGVLTQGDLRRPLRRAAALAPVMLLATLAAACGPAASPAPSPTPPPPAAASATTTPSPTATTPSAPSLPEQVESEAGAVAMMRYVFELYTYAFATNDASGFEAIGAKDCEFCSNVLSDVKENSRRGAVVVGGSLTVDRISARQINGDFYSGSALISEAATRTVGSDGALLESEEATQTDVAFALTWSSDRWKLREVGAERAESSS